MPSTRRRTLMFAAAFALAAGFAGSAFADPNGGHGRALYDHGIARPGRVEAQSAREHYRCAGPIDCPAMPE